MLLLLLLLLLTNSWGHDGIMMLYMLCRMHGQPQLSTSPSNLCLPQPGAPGAVCNATCAAGYSGTPFATCLADGSYSAVNGTCTLIRECLSETLSASGFVKMQPAGAPFD